MRVSLQIDGDASGAQKAAQDTTDAVNDLGKQTEAISQAIEDGFKNALGTIDKFKQGAQAAGAANDNGSNAALNFANRLTQVAQAATGADSALSKGASGAVSFAKGVGDLFKTVGTANVVGGAIGLAVTAATTLFNVIKDDGSEANRRLEEQARLIGVVRDAFSGAASKAEEFYQKSAAIVQFQAQQALIAAQADYKQQVAKLTAGNSYQPRFVEPFGAEGSIGFDQANEAAKKITPLQEALNELFASTQRGETTIEEARRRIAEIGIAARESAPEVAALAAEYLKASEPAAKSADTIAKSQALITLSSKSSTEAQKAQAREVLGLSDAASAAAGQFDRLMKSMERQAAAQEAEALTIGKSAGEAARLRAEFVLLEAAKQAGAGTAERYADEIKKISDRFGEAAQKAGMARLQSDAFFDRAQLGRTADDQALAAQLRGALGDNADLNSGIANIIRANNEMKELRSTAQDLGSGAISDLRSQVQTLGFTWQAAGNVALNVIDRLIQKLANKALDAGISKLFSLFGGVGGDMPSMTNPYGSMPRAGLDFADGGYTGAGGKYEPAGVVHKGEYVFDQEATNRIGLANLARMHRGYAEGGLVGGTPPWQATQSSASSAGASPEPFRIHVTSEVAMNDDGKLESRMKRISIGAANQVLAEYSGSEAAIQQHAQNHSAAKARTMV